MSTVSPLSSQQSLFDCLQRFAPQAVATSLGQVGYRQSGVQHITHVLLHGIGSASGSWLMQLEAAQGNDSGLLAWDAPGYGASSPVKSANLQAGEYADKSWAWLDALQTSQPIVHPSQRAFGRIINITSSAVKSPVDGLGPEVRRAQRLDGFCGWAGLARTTAAKGVTINNILPGTFDTARLTSNFAAAAKPGGLDAAQTPSCITTAFTLKKTGSLYITWASSYQIHNIQLDQR